MPVSRWLSPWVLLGVCSLASPALAQKKAGKAPAAQAATKKKAGEPAADEASPYAADGEKDPKAGADEKPPEASSKGDLDTPPPPRKKGSGGTPPSPLNPGPGEFPEGAAPGLPAELDSLLGQITALRSRVAALTTSLFSSRLSVVLDRVRGDTRVTSLVVTLDGGVVYRSPERFLGDDDTVLYEHAVAPGHHVIGVEVERHDPKDRQFATWQSSRLPVVVPDRRRLRVELVLEDRSDMAADFPDDHDGKYVLGIRLRARVVE